MIENKRKIAGSTKSLHQRRPIGATEEEVEVPFKALNSMMEKIWAVAGFLYSLPVVAFAIAVAVENASKASDPVEFVMMAFGGLILGLMMGLFWPFLLYYLS